MLGNIECANGRSRSCRQLARTHTQSLVGAKWAANASDQLLVTWGNGGRTIRTAYCLKSRSANWFAQCGHGPGVSSHQRRPAEATAIVEVSQGLNSPPQLVASLERKQARTLYDPNSALRRLRIGKAATVHFLVSKGRAAERVAAGLLLPADYVPGHRYAMVIQTHGYRSDRFLSTGGMVPFAARAFAAAGMVVMQLPQCRI